MRRALHTASPSLSTRDRILKALLEILTKNGYQSFTTTQVASYAGISITTLYRYFPNKSSLTFFVIDYRLDLCAITMEEACRKQHGKTLQKMVQTLVSAYCNVNFEWPDVTKVVDRSIDDIDKTALLSSFNRRVEAATSAMLLTASDVVFSNLSLTSLTLLTALFGAVRGIIERDLPSEILPDIHGELTRMCLAYLEAVSTS